MYSPLNLYVYVHWILDFKYILLLCQHYFDNSQNFTPTTLSLFFGNPNIMQWRVNLFDKGLNVNAGKSKVMVGRSGGKMILNSGKWPYGVCGKGVQAYSAKCTVCKKW